MSKFLKVRTGALAASLLLGCTTFSIGMLATGTKALAGPIMASKGGNGGGNTGGNTGTPAGSISTPFACGLGDVSIGGSSATACGTLTGTNSGDNNVIGEANTLFGTYGVFAYIDKAESPDNSAPATLLGGIKIEIEGVQYNNTPTWTLKWTDTDLASAPNLPAAIDLMLVFKAGQTSVAYLFDNLALGLGSPTGQSYSGSLNIRWTNNGGNNPALSHILAAGANLTGADVPPPPTEVPEPASFALLGMGLLGLGAARRLRRRTA